ncbi:MAG: fumarylacetoacetate hydrolase family protein [Oleispira sp.]|nr:fumarylacetoacetate hydrolase family protein [Oleispira sp.]
MKILATLFLICIISFLSYSSYLSRPVFNGHESEQAGKLSIASIEKGLTLTRDISGDIYLLIYADDELLKGINLSKTYEQQYKDALQAYQLLGKEQLITLYQSTQTQQLSWDQLAAPVSGQQQHIAVGTNYQAHAKEVGLDGKPFLFPKLSIATAWNSAVKAGTRLDHEVELCVLPINDYQRGDPINLAYVLCGDFTERWLLLKNIKLSGEMGKTGFVDAKGGESYLPLGPFLLIPHQAKLVAEIELSLYVNNQKRQQANISQMVWSFADILNHTLDDCQSIYQGVKANYVINDNCQSIAAGTLILTGTPKGVMFNLITMWNPYFYLQPGDKISSYATYLGKTLNRVK